MSAARPTATPEQRRELAWAGLCARCQHLEVLSNRRSVFVRCARSDAAADFPRYPVLPVVACRGWQQTD